jgi:flavin-dependent dehydrogenase
MSCEPDVVVLGGGPAGSTAATLLAQAGHKVRVYERDKFPRFHIGESFMPDTYWVLRRLGMIDKMKASHYTPKYSVQFVTDTGKESQPFYFFENNPHECTQTWQVLRSEFDDQLLRNAADHGVDVREEHRVMDVHFEGDRATAVRVRDKAGNEHVATPKVVIDSTGQSSVIANRLKLRVPDERLKKASVWSYFRGAAREPEKLDEGATLVLQLKEKKGWFWYIPQHDNIVSVGVVGDLDYIFSDKSSLEEIFWREVENCPAVKRRLEGSECAAEYRTTKDFSYRSKRIAGDNWVLTGDAFGFLDPIYSSGIQLAFRSGEMAADAVSQALKTNTVNAESLQAWAPEFIAGMDRIKKLVYAFYDGFSFGKFVMKYPHMRRHITDLLIGDVFKDTLDEVWEPMADVQRMIRSEAMLPTPAMSS